MEKPRADAGTPHQWTRRQRQVLDMLAEGRTNPEIARELGISLDGAKWHVSEILRELNVDSRLEAAEYWQRHRGAHKVGRWSLVPLAARWAGWAVVGVALVGVAAFAVLVLRESGEDGDGPVDATPGSVVTTVGTPPSTVVQGLGEARSNFGAVQLPDGRVVVAGGCCDASRQFVGSVEVLDPQTGTWSSVAKLNTPRANLQLVPLDENRVLALGGSDGRIVLDDVEIIDLRSGTSHSADPLSVPRNGMTATRLVDGRVLVTGGWTGETPTPDTEAFDPATSTWQRVEAMIVPRYGHTASLLPDGRVLVAGGVMTNDGGEAIAVASTELFDPITHSWSQGPSLATARTGHSATVLSDGSVLVVGGRGATGEVAQAERLSNLLSGWQPAGGSRQARGGHSATLAPSGVVVVAGGFSQNEAISSVEYFDPRTDSWAPGPPLSEARGSHGAALWGTAVAVFGGTTDGVAPLGSVEVIPMP